MKKTTNYDVYLNENGLVHCARCRLTGKFIRRDVAQFEYDKEYAYEHAPLITLIVLFVWWVVSCLKQVVAYADSFAPQAQTIEQVEGLILQAYQSGDDAQLFKLYGERYKLTQGGCLK